jgi:hypothetical protein
VALADTARLVASLELKDRFTKSLTRADRALGRFDTNLGRTEDRAFRAGQQIGTGIRRGAALAAVGIGILATQVHAGLQSLIELEDAQAQTEARIKSTGGVAGVTAKDVRALAEEYEALNATIGDETIQEAENLLLSFTKISKKAFEPALAIALDMNQALGGGPEGLAGNAKLLGKALQDPEKGLSRLGRAVGGFSDETVKAVKAAVKQNDILGAQQIIIDELTERYGGSFARAGDTTRGSVAKFTDAIEDLQRALATAALPAVRNMADALSDFLQDEEVIRATERLGSEVGKLFSKENISTGIQILKDGFDAAKAAAPIIANAARIMGSVLSTAVGVFRSLPPELQNLAIAGLAVNKLTGGLVTTIAGGLISSVLKQLVSGVVNVTGATVIVNGPGLMGDVTKGGAGKAGAAGAAATVAKAAAGVTIVGIAGVAAATIAGATRDSENRIINSQGNIARTVADGNQKLANVNAGIARLRERVASGDVFAQRQLDALIAVRDKLRTESPETNERLAALKAMSQKTKDDTVAATRKTTTQVQVLKERMATRLDRVTSTDIVQSGATRNTIRAGTSAITSTIRANRPIINVDVRVTATHVTKSVTYQNRYGPGGGSGAKDHTGAVGVGEF